MQVYLKPLRFYDRVEIGILRATVAWLGVAPETTVLDAGCGEGTSALILAEIGASVTALDLDETKLQTARKLLAGTPFADRVVFQTGSILELSFPDNHFDLVWCSYVLHHLADKEAAVRELRRVLKPEGKLVIREGGLPLQMLPFDLGLGEPGLQDRLRVADNRWFAAMTQATLPDAAPYPYGWSQLLYDTKFASVTARTFVLDLLPPFDEAESAFVVFMLGRTLERDAGEYGPLLADEDREVLRQLLEPASPHYLLKRNDLHVRYGLSVYVGVKPCGSPRAGGGT